MYIYIYLHRYINIYRERERKRKREMYIHYIWMGRMTQFAEIRYTIPVRILGPANRVNQLPDT